MSKSLFLLLLMVSLLTAGVSFQSDGLRLEGETRLAGTELRAGIRSLKSDTVDIYWHLTRLPAELPPVWKDFVLDWKDLFADVSVEARFVTRHIESLLMPRQIS